MKIEYNAKDHGNAPSWQLSSSCFFYELL
jgi:hypothetical protein